MDSCFKEVKTVLSLYLAPSRIDNILIGVEEQLDEYIMSYIDEYNGVIISYSDIKFISKNGAIYFDKPNIHFNIQVKLLIFSPNKGSLLIGTVNKITLAHIGLLVHGVFNVTIPIRSIRQEYTYNNDDNYYYNTNYRIQVGSMIQFQVLSVNSSNSFVSIIGSLRKLCTGPMEEVKNIIIADNDLELDAIDLANDNMIDSSINIPNNNISNVAPSSATKVKNGNVKKRISEEPAAKEVVKSRKLK